MKNFKNYIVEHKKGVLIGMAGVLAVLAAIFVILDLLKNAYISIVVTPLDSKIYINGEVYSNGTFRRYPGRANIKIERDGMVTKSFELDLVGGKTTLLHVYLNGEGEDFSYYDTSIDDYETLKIIADDELSKEYIKEMERKLSVLDVLPLTKWTSADTPSPSNGQLSRETIISDGTERIGCDRIICLLLQDNTGSEETARALLRAAGYDFDDYKIIIY